MFLESSAEEFLPYITIPFVIFVWYYAFFYKPFAKFPSWRMEFRLPLWVLMRRKLEIEFLYKAIETAKKYEKEGVFVGWFFKPRVVVYGEEIVKSVLPHTAVKPSVFRVAEFSFGDGIFISNGERWKKQRKLVSSALHIRAIKSYASFMNNNAKLLVKRFTEMNGDSNFDICEVMSQCMLHLLYETNFGVKDRDSEAVNRSVSIVHKTTDFFTYRFFRPWFHFDFWMPYSSYAREIIKLDLENRKRLEQILENIQESVIARGQSQATEKEEEDDDALIAKPKTIGENIIEDHLKNQVFTMEELAKEVYFLIFAGFDTAAHALVWIFYSLGLHPEIQDRVYDEISTLQKEDIQYADVQDLTYLDCVIKESLRKYTIPTLLRILTEDVKCGDYVIPKNTEVLIFAYMVHRDKNVYPDPEKFDPERFMDENSKIRPWNHIPFMEGPRTCVGKNYAMLSMKIIITHVLRHFKVISLTPEEDLTFKMALILCAEKKPRMKFVPRHKSSDLEK